ncbi:MAG: hypothetical protein HKN68_01055 [Saprospiraceae bacterium]|nr:hypothetical protein [Saprospiraceae bacterium]
MVKWLIRIVYRVVAQVYPWLIKMASIKNDKAAAWIQGRRNQQSFIDKIRHWPNGKTIWVHAASSGEYQQVLPIMKAYKAKHPETRYVLTFFSPSGYQQWANETIADAVGYLPWETSGDLTTFIDTIQPSCVWIVKNEFWFHFLSRLQKKKIPVIFISTFVKRNSHIFFPYFRDIVIKVSHFFVQDENSAAHFKENGINHVTVTGDTRIDHVLSLTDKQREIPRLETLKKHNSMVFVYGSIYPEDMKIIQPFISEYSEDVHIIVPHNVSVENINKILFKLNRPATKYSDESTLVSPVIIDAIGILNQIYQLADCVYIGGGFNHGIHNTLEPAVYGIPLLFGPKYQKFPEALEFIKLGLAKNVNTNLEFSSGVQSLLNDKEAIKSKSEAFFSKFKGASSKVLNTMHKLGLCQN